ncbi:hypothetical protein [Dongia deserti]|uniref:hypothetical protein n=1 Tax=Dongia deserti TaxID=2268030 RepID=UPI000E658D19|nr:hypothetical protein [Dongia deserti]
MIAILGGAIAALAVFCATYGALYVTGYLPPPPLSNNICTDEKLLFFRRNPPAEPNFVVIGSSIAWRNIDSAAIASGIPGAQPLNGGFCGLMVHQSAFVADWMISRWPAIRGVLLIVSPMDFKACKGTGQIFDPVDANEFTFEGAPMWSFYLRYFDPISLHHNVMREMSEREQERILKVSRRFTKYGDKPFDTKEDRGLFYGRMRDPDPACLTALRSLATTLAEQGRSFMVVVTPIHPDWHAQYDADRRFTKHVVWQLTDALTGTRARIWDADAARVIDSSGFIDAVHLRWSAATILTSAIVEHFRANRGL